MTQDQSPVAIAVAFIKTLETGDMATAASYLADDVVFEGPMTRFTDAKTYLVAMGQFAEAVGAVNVIATVGDGEQAAVVYDMKTGPFGTIRAIEHFVINDGKIQTDRLAFDTYEVRKAHTMLAQ
jgi:SnoaL-like protein